LRGSKPGACAGRQAARVRYRERSPAWSRRFVCDGKVRKLFNRTTCEALLACQNLSTALQSFKKGARRILHPVTGVTGVPAEWKRAELLAAAHDFAAPVKPNDGEVAMTAETIAKALGGHRAGATWMARCPVHDDSSPSLAIGTGKHSKVLVHCHAGCDQRDVIAALIERGLWDATGKCRGGIARTHRMSLEREPDPDARARTEAALAIWRASHDIVGSLAETYLRSRGIVLSPLLCLRFHPGLKHASGGVWPAMVALVVHGQTGEALGIHRTFLARDGHGKAPVDLPKMMLGPCRGGVVQLAEPGDVLMVGEGIETCLAAMQATGKPAWAALSTSGLRSLDLPRAIAKVIVLADGDAPGEAAAQDCARRWQLEGRSIRIARPPSGMDFNDLLKPCNSTLPEDAQ
jgi:putative DNA primase/helicase